MNKKILMLLIVGGIILIIGLVFTMNFKELKNREKNDVPSTNQKPLEENPSFFGEIIESNSNYIIVKPDENEEERKSTDKISIGLGEHNDAIYSIGTRVKITYTGGIMETDPAQVNVVKIEIKSANKIELKISKNTTNNKIKNILTKDETELFDYNVYEYNCDVNIIIDGKEMPLKDALLKYPNILNEIIAQANSDLSNEKIKGDMYKDGGSIIYFYDNYTIIKMHTLDGNRDVYIGTTDMTIHDTV